MNSISKSPAVHTASRTKASAAHGPDLVIDGIQPSNPFPYSGDDVYFKVTVKNDGDRPAPPFSVQLSTDSGGLNQQERVSKGLPAGKEVSLNGFGPLHVGFESIDWVTATADCRNEVQETREDNNQETITLSPQNPFPPQPPHPPIPPLPPTPVPRVIVQS